MARSGSVRNYAIEFVGARRSTGGSLIAGGNALLDADQHALDGAEHTGTLPIEDVSTTETDTTKVAAPDGAGGVEFRAESGGVTVAEEDGSPSVAATTIEVPNGGLEDDGGGVVSLHYAQHRGGGRHARQAIGNLGAAHTFDMTDYNYFTGTLDDATAVDFTGWTAGVLCEIGIRFTVGAAGDAPDFSGAGVTWVGDTEPTWPTTVGVSYETVFWSEDGGTTIVGGMLGAGGSDLTIEDEGTPLATAATTLDFVGAGVTASGAGAEKTITIPGDAAHIAGATDAHDASAISFAPAGSIAATDVQAAIEEVAAEVSGSNVFVVDPGAPSYAGSPLTVSLTSVFGIDGSGNPYYNAAGVTSGEEAALMRDPDTGTYLLRSYNF